MFTRCISDQFYDRANSMVPAFAVLNAPAELAGSIVIAVIAALAVAGAGIMQVLRPSPRHQFVLGLVEELAQGEADPPQESEAFGARGSHRRSAA